MQWIMLAVWYGAIIHSARRKDAWLHTGISAGLAVAMGMQLILLKTDELFTWEAALPLHLCSLFGVCGIFMLRRPPPLFWEACCFLGAPGAFLTLFFPAVIRCSHPLLMQLAFYQLHVLVALTPVYWHATGKPLPADPRRTLVWGSGYLVFISLINRIFGTNYLFLRAVPADTPLEWLFSRGTSFYLCSLVMLCMLIFTWLRLFYRYCRK